MRTLLSSCAAVSLSLVAATALAYPPQPPPPAPCDCPSPEEPMCISDLGAGLCALGLYEGLSLEEARNLYLEVELLAWRASATMGLIADPLQVGGWNELVNVACAQLAAAAMIAAGWDPADITPEALAEYAKAVRQDIIDDLAANGDIDPNDGLNEEEMAKIEQEAKRRLREGDLGGMPPAPQPPPPAPPPSET